MIITLDGPAGAGKTTTANYLSHTLNAPKLINTDRTRIEKAFFQEDRRFTRGVPELLFRAMFIHASTYETPIIIDEFWLPVFIIAERNRKHTDPKKYIKLFRDIITTNGDEPTHSFYLRITEQESKHRCQNRAALETGNPIPETPEPKPPTERDLFFHKLADTMAKEIKQFHVLDGTKNPNTIKKEIIHTICG